MLALWLIIVIATIATGLSSSTRASSGIAANRRAHAVGRYAAESGIVVALTDLEDNLARFSDTASRQRYLNSIETAGDAMGEAELGDARFKVTYVDVSSRLDVNAATRPQLARFFSFFTGSSEAASAATAIRDWIGAEDVSSSHGLSLPQRNDITYPALPPIRPLRSLDDLRRIPGVNARLAYDAVPFLTVDGDGRINRMTASDTVLAAVGGSLQNEPSRIMVIARGWLAGQPLTCEIQAVYAIDGKNVTLVRWRERDL